MKMTFGITGVVLLYAGNLPFREPGVSGALIYVGVCLCLSAVALLIYPLLEQQIEELELAHHLERQKEVIRQRKLAQEKKENEQGARELSHQPSF